MILINNTKLRAKKKVFIPKEKKLYALVLTFEKKFCERIFYAWKKLNDKFGIKYISSRSPKPHITVLSGYVDKPDLFINKLKKTKLKKFYLCKLGIGLLAQNDPLLYLRWEYNKKLIKIFHYLNNNFYNFFHYKKKQDFSFWMPKTTLIYKDFKYKDMNKVMFKLKTLSNKEKILISNLELMEVDLKLGEKIIFSKKLI